LYLECDQSLKGLNFNDFSINFNITDLMNLSKNFSAFKEKREDYLIKDLLKKEKMNNVIYAREN
jgi:hypothetical protein